MFTYNQIRDYSKNINKTINEYLYNIKPYPDAQIKRLMNKSKMTILQKIILNKLKISNTIGTYFLTSFVLNYSGK